MSRPGPVWAPPGRPPGPLLGGFSLSEDARGGGVVRLEVLAPVYAWVQFETFSWRIDTAVVLAATPTRSWWSGRGSGRFSRRGCGALR